MLYQKLLTGSNPFFVSATKATAFEMHRHPEIELSYCLKGSYPLICGNRHETLHSGDLVLIFPMVAHELPESDGVSERLTVEMGYVFLGDFFKAFTGGDQSLQIYRESEWRHSPLYKELVKLPEELAEVKAADPVFEELILKGNLYRIAALLLQMRGDHGHVQTERKRSTDIENMDRALEKIYNNYYEPLNVAEISASCGYSKSNFCKIFKTVTGDAFHRTLNRHRIEISCMLLRETNEPVERIAQETGFADCKSFCRVFKKMMNQSAGEYRKKVQAR